jgi:Tfp pilus assembly pilus retraction ATPase PilT
VHEILSMTPEVGALVAEGRTAALLGVMRARADVGMQALDETLEGLVRAGRIAAETALERATDKAELARRIAAPGPPALGPSAPRE